MKIIVGKETEGIQISYNEFNNVLTIGYTTDNKYGNEYEIYFDDFCKKLNITKIRRTYVNKDKKTK